MRKDSTYHYKLWFWIIPSSQCGNWVKWWSGFEAVLLLSSSHVFLMKQRNCEERDTFSASGQNTYLWVCWRIFGHLPTGYSPNGIWLTRWEFTCKCCHLEALYLGEDERVCLTPWLCPEVCTTKWNFQILMGDMSFQNQVFFLNGFPNFRTVSPCPQNIIKLGSLASRGCETEKPKRMIRSLSDQVF